MRKKITLYSFALLGILLLLNSCKKEYETIESIDDAKIQAYVKSNTGFVKDPAGYYYKIVSPGTGAELKNSDSLYYSYTFKSLDGKVFNQTSDLMIPGTFLGYTDRFVINGSSYLFTPIREVLTKLKRGGKASLIMPSYMAFGKNGVSILNIGTNENIVLDLGIYSQSKQHEIDEFEIQTFIAKNSIIATKDLSRVYYQVLTPGTGTDVINLNSALVVKYTGRLLDGTIFDSSTSFSTTLAETISGWQKVIPLFKAGAKIRIFIPSDLAYSTIGNGAVPANAVLDFDIEIVSVTN
ncbi:MAG: FKBP-type peptidyl-prolyl cis-trans isomerase [Pedobacter sp.]|uniref:FKBP-type peptidyl-prolyl cis-trans isomerase n=1 Tax=Pedobacter sp. TaxID=1411316 RepID=UPI003564F433